MSELENEFDELAENLPTGYQYNFTQEDVEYVWGLWADFSVYIVYPAVKKQFPPKLIEPEKDSFKCKIYDYGNELRISRGESLASGLRTYGRLMNTIEDMIDEIVKRAVEDLGGSVDEEGGGAESIGEQEIQVAFNGFEILQRKAFRLCIESEFNVLVVNFDPGEWGERQLRCFNELVCKGYLKIRM